MVTPLHRTAGSNSFERDPRSALLTLFGVRIRSLLTVDIDDSGDRLALQLALSDGRSRDDHDDARIAQLLHSVATDLSVACTLVL